jgi:hypothetical protein
VFGLLAAVAACNNAGSRRHNGLRSTTGGRSGRGLRESSLPEPRSSVLEVSFSASDNQSDKGVLIHSVSHDDNSHSGMVVLKYAWYYLRMVTDVKRMEYREVSWMIATQRNDTLMLLRAGQDIDLQCLFFCGCSCFDTGKKFSTATTIVKSMSRSGKLITTVR